MGAEESSPPCERVRCSRRKRGRTECTFFWKIDGAPESESEKACWFETVPTGTRLLPGPCATVGRLRPAPGAW